ncbi:MULTISPECIES: Gfo/Idh/MocA family protein [unclassified Mesorhizobium]|uniref:Gfo/Idh/MocA family protein n=1 Tax=unclassified Mesorhizobium TaxID=325217 RepID=UPI0019284392|nr:MULTISPECIES: Gfo/Idh/MocA family oxidoreductase [unclassified Mesorhizobium]
MTSISIGLIGAGLIGRKHLRKIAEHPDYTLAGISDVNSDAVAAQYPEERVYADYRAMLDEARPEAVIIASPNQLHADAGVECARRGIHILVEKPVTDTAEAARVLIAETRRSGIKTLVGHHRRHHDQVQQLRSLLTEGNIGALVGVSAIWAVYKPDDYFKAAPWRTQPGGGPILINLIHEVDFLRFTAGEIVAVSAISSNRQRHFGVEDTAAALMEFENGAIGTIIASDSAVSPWSVEQGTGESVEFPFSGESPYRFIGSHGSLEFPTLVRWGQTDGARSWNRPVISQRLFATTIDPYLAQLNHFRDVIRGAASTMQSVEDGARTLIATLAVTEAAATGARIDLRDRYEALSGAFASSPAHARKSHHDQQAHLRPERPEPQSAGRS